MIAVKLIRNKQFPLDIPEGTVIKHGDLVIVLTEKGEEVTTAYYVPPQVESILRRKKVPSIPFVRIMTEDDKKEYEEIQKMEEQGYKDCLELIKQHNLQMNLIQCKYTFDKRKVTFYYTAPERVDFRNLLKDLTKVFKRVRIDLKHIGVRDETSLCCGNGLCGRTFCCCTFKRQFDSINIKLAHDQSMPITPSKISGTCGRLLCCLNYEYKNYIETAKEMVPIGSGVMTQDGVGRVCALNILTDKVSVKLSDGKIKEYPNKEVEMIDTDVNIEIDTNSAGYKYASMQQTEEHIDIKLFEDQFEVCDILHNNCFYHTKIKRNPESMSHLFQQGYVSGASFAKYTNEYIEATNNVIDDPTQRLSGTPNGKTIHYLVLSQADNPRLSFFQKMSLEEKITSLTAYQFTVKISLIKGCPWAR